MGYSTVKKKLSFCSKTSGTVMRTVVGEFPNSGARWRGSGQKWGCKEVKYGLEIPWMLIIKCNENTEATH